MVESFAAVRDAVFERAGGAHSPDEAALMLGISRGALHQKMMAGDLMAVTLDGAVVVPKLQFAEATVIPGVAEVVRMFRESQSGMWSALQWLIDADPNLRGTTPIAALRDGHVEVVVAAARAYVRGSEA